MRSIGSLYNAGRTRAFSQRMMNAEADPLRKNAECVFPSIEKDMFRTPCRQSSRATEIDAALLVNCVEYDSESTAPHVQETFSKRPGLVPQLWSLTAT